MMRAGTTRLSRRTTRVPMGTGCRACCCGGLQHGKPAEVLWVAASQLAEISGANPYVKQMEAEERFLQRNRQLAQRLGRKVAPRCRRKVEAVLHALPPEVLADVAEAQQLPSTAPPATVAEALQRAVVAPSVAARTEAESHQEVVRLTQQHPALAAVAQELAADTRMQRGEAREDGALDTASEALGQAVRGRNTQLHSRNWLHHRGFTVAVRGKVDGVAADGRIIETKNRSRRLFGKVPMHEQVQLCAYMWLLEGTPRAGQNLNRDSAEVSKINMRSCTHVENLDGVQVRFPANSFLLSHCSLPISNVFVGTILAGDQIVTDFQWDGELWARCERGVRSFLDTLLASAAEAKHGIGGELPASDCDAGRIKELTPSKLQTYQLFTDHGSSVGEVARAKSIQPRTVIGYLLDARAHGFDVDLDRLPQADPIHIAAVRAAVQDICEEAGGRQMSIRQVRERLGPGKVPYADVRLQLVRDGSISE